MSIWLSISGGRNRVCVSGSERVGRDALVLLVVALLPEDAEALDEEYEHVPADALAA